MNKNKLGPKAKRIFACTLALAMSANMIMPGMLAYADEIDKPEIQNTTETTQSTSDETGVLTSGKCGANATYTLKSDGTMVISGTGPMYSYQYDSKEYCSTAPWASGYRSKIKKNIIEDGITSVGAYAFKETGYGTEGSCTHLEEIVIGNDVKTIETEAFYACNPITVASIKKISLGSGIKTIEKDAFATTGAVEMVTVPSLDVWMGIDFANEAATPMWGGTFPRDKGKQAALYVNEEKLVNLTVPEETTEIKPYTFRNCRLSSVSLPDSLTEIGVGAFSYNNFSSITIPESVQQVGDEAFAGCINLEDITLPDNLKTIGKGVFGKCTSLNYIKLSENLTSIPAASFSSCTNLSQVTLPDTVTSIGDDAFTNCTSLTNIKIPEQVTEIGTSAFSKCTSLSAITIPDSVKTIGNNAFYGAEKLSEVQLPSNITEIGEWTFYGCSNLKKVTVPSRVTKIGTQAFANCSALTAITLPEGVTIIANSAFSGCTELTSFTLPKQIKTIEDYTFAGCGKLSEIEIPSGIECIGNYVFSKCTSLTKLVLPNTVQSVGEFVFSGCCALQEVNLSDQMSSVSKYAFENCTGLTKITVPEKINLIDNYAFYGCSGLNEIVFTGNAPTIEKYAFGKVKATCYYPKGNTTYTSEIRESDFGGDLKWTYEGEEETPDLQKCGEDITWSLSENGVLTLSGSGAMYDYSSIAGDRAPWYEDRKTVKSIQLSDGITHIGSCAFYDCQSATEVSIPESVTSIGKYAFYYCKFVNVVLPDNLEEISESMFEQCRYLQHVTFPTKLKRIEKNAFAMCLGLYSVEIPEGVISIGNYAFWSCGYYDGWSTAGYSCSNFTSVKLPSTLKTLGQYAFCRCAVLKEINIPDGLAELQSGTFQYCYRLKTVTFEWGVPKLPTDIFETLYSGTVTLTCYYPSNNPAWTADKLKNYGAKSIKWVPKEMDKPSSGSGGDTGSGGSGSGGTGEGTGESGSGSDSGSGSGSGNGGSGSGSGSSSGGTSGSGSESGGNTGSGGSGSGSESGSGSGSESGGGTIGAGEMKDMGFSAHSLTLNGDIGVNFYLELNDTIKQDTSAVLEFSINGKEVSSVKVSEAIKNGSIEVKDTTGVSHACYKFSCNINAKQMTDTIQATLKTASGTWKEEYSVQKYADEAKNGDNEKLTSIVNAMLTYGAYAQKLFGYRTDTLAGGTLPSLPTVTVDELSSYAYKKSGSEENLMLDGSSLLLKDKTTIRIYYQLKSGNISDYTFYVDGQVVTPTKSGNAGLYYVEVKDIAAQDLGVVHTFRVGSLSVTNFSALSYVKAVFEYDKSTEDNKNAMTALYLYYQAAKKYFETRERER